MRLALRNFPSTLKSVVMTLGLASTTQMVACAPGENAGDGDEESQTGKVTYPMGALQVSGSLTNGESDVDDAVISNQGVSLVRSDGATLASGTTDASGNFTIDVASGALMTGTSFSLLESSGSDVEDALQFYLVAKTADATSGKAVGVRRRVDLATNAATSSVGEETVFAVGATPLREVSAITGKIAFADSSVTLEGADIYIPGQPFFVRTGDDGIFNLFFVPAGSYNIRVSKAPFIKDVEVSVELGKTTNLDTVTIEVNERNPMPLADVLMGTWKSTCYYKDAGSVSPENPATGQFTITALDSVTLDSGSSCILRTMGAGSNFTNFTKFIVLDDGALVGQHGTSYFFYSVTNYSNSKINILINDVGGISTGTAFEIIEKVIDATP